MRQKIMETLRVTISRISLGEIELLMPFMADFTQQHGFIHAGAIATVLDNACGYAGFTRMQPGSAVLTVEFKRIFWRLQKEKAFDSLGRQ